MTTQYLSSRNFHIRPFTALALCLLATSACGGAGLESSAGEGIGSSSAAVDISIGPVIPPPTHITAEQLRGDVYVAKEDGTKVTSTARWADLFCTDNQSCLVGDVNGDAKDDLIAVARDTGDVWVAKSTGTGLAFPTKWATGLCKWGENDCRIADINGDKSADLVILGVSFAGEPDTQVALSDKTKFLAPQTKTGWRCHGHCEYANIYGDATAEVIRVESYYPNGLRKPSEYTIYAGIGTPTAVAGLPQSAFSGAYDLDVGDVTGDGKADAVLFTHNATGDVYLIPSVNGRFPTATLAHNYFCVTGEVCEVADVIGDSRADIVAFTRGTSGKIWAAPGTSAGFGASVQLAGSTDTNKFCTDRQVCRIGNLDGTGRPEFIAFQRGEALPVATRPAPTWLATTPAIDLDTCRNNADKIGVAKIRDLPAELQHYLLDSYEAEYEGMTADLDVNMLLAYFDLLPTSEVLVYVAPKHPTNVLRTTNLADAIARLPSDSSHQGTVIVVADEVQLSGTITTKRNVIIVAQKVTANNAQINITCEKSNGSCLAGTAFGDGFRNRFAVFASSMTGQATVSIQDTELHPGLVNIGALPTTDPPPRTSPVVPTILDLDRLFQVASSVSDELMFVDTWVERADLAYRTGAPASGAYWGYPLANGVLQDSQGRLPDTLKKRAEGLQYTLDARITSRSAGFDLLGTSPNLAPALTDADQYSKADGLITELSNLTSDYYLANINSNVNALIANQYGQDLQQSVGEIAVLRRQKAQQELAEKNARVDSAEANVDRANAALSAAQSRLDGAKAALKNKPSLLDIVVAGAGCFSPASDFIKFGKSAIDAARADTGGTPAAGGTPGKKSAFEWLSDGAKQGAGVVKPLSDFYSKLSGAVADNPDCQSSSECKAFIFDVEAANAAVTAATSNLKAAGFAAAAAQTNLQLVEAERLMYEASAEALAASQEQAARRAEGFCHLATLRLDDATLAVNEYRRLRALHDAPLDLANPAYVSTRYDYALLMNYGNSDTWKTTLRQALSLTAGQTLQVLPGLASVGVSDPASLAQMLKTSKVGTSSGYVIELEARLVDSGNSTVTLLVAPSNAAVAAGAVPNALESADNLASLKAVQGLKWSLRVTSSNYVANYYLPVSVTRPMTDTVVLQRSPLVEREMFLDLGVKSVEDRLPSTGVGLYELALTGTTSDFPWRFAESLDKTWTIHIPICSGSTSNGSCVAQADLNSITGASLTAAYRFKN